MTEFKPEQSKSLPKTVATPPHPPFDNGKGLSKSDIEAIATNQRIIDTEREARERESNERRTSLNAEKQLAREREMRHQGLQGSITEHFEEDEMRHQGLQGSITEAFKKRELNKPNPHYYKGQDGKEYSATDEGLAAMRADNAASWKSQPIPKITKIK